MAVEVREDVPLEELLLTVQRELFRADRTDLPVTLHVLLESALLKVRRENHLAQRTAAVSVPAGVEAEACPGLCAVLALSFIRVLWGVLAVVRGAGAAAGLDTDHLLGPPWCCRRCRRA